MRQAFTLIELMIVIAIIAIIAAIAIPNLLESRISSNEAAAASSLKSGIFPAQVTFQSGSYVDMGGPSTTAANGIGDYAEDLRDMAGFSDTTAGNAIPDLPLAMLPPTWNTSTETNAIGPNNSSYVYVNDANYETGFVTACWPVDLRDSVGRRRFAVNGSGQVYATSPNSVNAAVDLTATTGTNAQPFGSSFTSSAISGWSPYKR